MKITKSYLASLLLLGAAFTACDDELDRPPVIVPEATIEANSSILEVKKKYWNENRNYIDTIGVNEFGEHIVVSGRVISSDETGNIYKNLVIQDKTAALTISINENDMFESYHIGQEVVIDLTNMYIGKYNGLCQLGYPKYSDSYGWEATFMEMDHFKQHAQYNELPRPTEIDTFTVDIKHLNSIKSNADSLQRWQSQLVRFDSVYWAEAGKPYSDPSASTNRYIKDANGNKMIVRNSSYATFHDKLLPSGYGSVVGILSYFGTDWQVLLRSTDDCIGFDESVAPDTPSTPSQAVNTLNETFENVSSVADIKGWTSKVVKGNKDWYFTSFDNNYYAACTAYKGTDDGNGYDAWLITPALNVDSLSEKTFSFDSQAAYSGGAFEVYVMTTNDPATATLTKVDCTLATPPASGYSGFVSSGVISLAQYTGTIHIGFRYTATTSASSMTFCIDNVKAPASATEEPSEPDQPSTPSTPVEGNVADFNTMNGGEAKSSYGEYTSANGWKAINSALLSGTSTGTDSNPKFTFLGDESVFAPCLNGKVGAAGVLTSPLLAGGIKKLSFNYGFPFTDSKCNITINIKQDGAVVKTDTLDITSITKFQVYSYSLDVNVSGNFEIEIVNNSASQSTSNKDRIAIWNLTWTN